MEWQMNKYQYAQLRINQAALFYYLGSTDSVMLHWIGGEIKKKIPKAEIRFSTSFDETYALSASKLQGLDVELQWWTVAQLCLRGWEPFAANNDYVFLRLVQA
jgi:hypothetical protein